MSRICVIALIGLPAAGKTTFSQELLSCEQLPFNVAHFCFDDFLQCDYSQQQAELFAFKTERTRILALLQSVVESLKTPKTDQSIGLEHNIPLINHNSKDYVILCDDNNYYTSMRYKIYQLCRTNEVCYGQIYFPIDLTLSLQRNAQRNIQAQVPQLVIEQMLTRLELPNPKKNSWELYTLNFDFNISLNTAFANVLNFIAHVFQNYALTTTRTVEVLRKQHDITPLHNLDIMLRRRIKETLEDSSLTPESKRRKAKDLNLKRKEILLKYSKNTASEIDSLSLDQLNDICKLLH